MNQIEMKKRQMEMVSYILSLIVLLVLGNILGDNGIVFLAIAVECFLLFWTFTGSRLADTLGRLLRGRSNKGQYKNAMKLRRISLVLEGFLGMIGCVVMFLSAKNISEGLLDLPYSVTMIRILAPVIFIRTLSSVLLGYFQGEGTELPTVISCLMRQVCVLGLSLFFVGFFKDYGSKVSALLRQENFTAMYGGMGVAVAVLVSEILVLLFLLLVYRGSRRKERRNNGEGMRTTDTFAGQTVALYRNLLPQILAMFLGLFPMWLGMVLYRRSVADFEALNEYGILFGKFLPLIGIMILPGCIMLMENAYKAAGCVRREEQRYARGHFQSGLHMAVVYGFFLSVFTAIMAQQLSGVLNETGLDLTVEMLRYGSFIVLLGVIAFYFTELLLLLVGKFFVLGLLVLYNLVHAGCLALFINGGETGIMSLVYSLMFAGVVYVVGATVLLFWQLRFGIDWLQAIAVPAGVSCAVGLILVFLTKVITPHLGNLITVIVSLILGNVFYWIFLMILRNFREQELAYTPCGKLIRIIGQTFRVY